MNLYDFVGSNADSHTGKGKSWKMATRHNQKSKELNGHVTVCRKRKVNSYKSVGVL